MRDYRGHMQNNDELLKSFKSKKYSRGLVERKNSFLPYTKNFLMFQQWRGGNLGLPLYPN